jgi:hypothetical protein
MRSRAPPAGSARYVSPVNGWCMMPATARPSVTSPMRMPQVGMPLMKARVPSIGSMTQQVEPSPVAPCSSPRMR